MNRVRRLLAVLLFALVAVVGLGAAARASDERAVAPPPPRPTAGEWQPADLGQMQSADGYKSTTLVTAAYSFVWLALLAFVASVWLRGKGVERELADLERRIADAQKRSAQ